MAKVAGREVDGVGVVSIKEVEFVTQFFVGRDVNFNCIGDRVGGGKGVEGPRG